MTLRERLLGGVHWIARKLGSADADPVGALAPGASRSGLDLHPLIRQVEVDLDRPRRLRLTLRESAAFRTRTGRSLIRDGIDLMEMEVSGLLELLAVCASAEDPGVTADDLAPHLAGRAFGSAISALAILIDGFHEEPKETEANDQDEGEEEDQEDQEEEEEEELPEPIDDEEYWSLATGTLGIPDELYWRMTPRLIAQLYRRWETAETIRDSRAWGIAIATAKLGAGERVEAADHFPFLGLHDQEEDGWQESMAHFQALAASAQAQADAQDNQETES